MRSNQSWLTLMFIVLAVAMSAAVGAQEEGEAHEPMRLIVHYDHVTPSMTEDFERISKDWVTAFKEAEMGADWNWWTSVSNDFVYVTAFRFGDWQELDRETAREAEMQEALGEEKLAALNELSGSIHHHYSIVAELRPELGYSPETSAVGENPKFMRVGIHTVKPGMGERFEALMKGVSEAFGKAESGMGWNVYEIEFGEGSYAVTAYADDAAQFYGMPSTGETLTKAHGAEKMQEMYDEWRECIVDFETTDWTLRPDLSYEAAESE